MNKTKLANTLGISRATLYNRAKAFSIDLSKDLTADQLKSLEQNISVKESTVVEVLHPKNTVDSDKVSKEVDTLSNQSLDTFRQLSKQNEQLSKQIERLFIQLENKDSQLKSAQKLIDQSQQLQLDLQHQLSQNEQNKTQLLIENKNLQDELTHEKDKGFWQYLFRK